MVGARNNYFGVLGDKYALVHFRGSYLEVDIDDMRAANSLFGWANWARCGITIACRKRKVPDTLPGGFPSANFSRKDAKWDFKSKSNDVGKHGHAVNSEAFLRTDH